MLKRFSHLTRSGHCGGLPEQDFRGLTLFPPAPIYGWFTEGFDTLDLKEAKSLLAMLA
jgi:hypothetical protein